MQNTDNGIVDILRTEFSLPKTRKPLLPSFDHRALLSGDEVLFDNENILNHESLC
jgi:hypothetical protein